MNDTALPPHVRLLILRLVAIAGIAMLTLMLLAMNVMPRTLAWMPEGFVTPILAVEFVADINAARQMLGDDTAAISGLLESLSLDNAFLVVYGIFLAGLALVLVAHPVRRYITLVFALAAPVADYLENRQLQDLLQALQGASLRAAENAVDFTWLRLWVVIKFAAIAVLMVRLLGGIWSQGTMGRALALAITLNAFATGFTFVGIPYAVEVMASTTAMCWTMLWVWTLLQLWMSRQQAQ